MYTKKKSNALWDNNDHPLQDGGGGGYFIIFIKLF